MSYIIVAVLNLFREVTAYCRYLDIEVLMTTSTQQVTTGTSPPAASRCSDICRHMKPEAPSFCRSPVLSDTTTQTNFICKIPYNHCVTCHQAPWATKSFLASSNKTPVYRRERERPPPIADCWGLINHLGKPSKQIIPTLQKRQKKGYTMLPHWLCWGRGKRGKFCLEREEARNLLSGPFERPAEILKYSMSVVWGGCTQSALQSLVSLTWLQHHTGYPKTCIAVSLFQKFNCLRTQGLVFDRLQYSSDFSSSHYCYIKRGGKEKINVKDLQK